MVTSPKKPKTPPQITSTVPLGLFEPLFDAGDVTSLAKKTGLPLGRLVDPSEAAYRWWKAYDEARIDGVHPKGFSASPKARRAYYQAVLTAARKLWERLGIPGDIASAKDADFVVQDAEQWFANLIEPVASDSVPGLNRAATELAHGLIGLSNGPPYDPNMVLNTSYLELKPIWNGLKAAPYAIALIATLAEGGIEELRKVPGARGRPGKTFKNTLYYWLAGEYRYAFGHRPETGRERDQPNCASSIWVDNLTNLAAERIATRILLNVDDAVDRAERVKRHPLVIAATEVAQQAFVTKADALAEGWKKFAAKSGNSSKPKKPRTRRVSTPPSA